MRSNKDDRTLKRPSGRKRFIQTEGHEQPDENATTASVGGIAGPPSSVGSGAAAAAAAAAGASQEHQSSLSIIRFPADLDVILGREKLNAWQGGNVKLLRTIESRMAEYRQAKGRLKKTRIIQEIYDATRTTGRFLTRIIQPDDNTGNVTGDKQQQQQEGYYEVDDITAKERIGYMIRYRKRIAKPATRGEGGKDFATFMSAPSGTAAAATATTTTIASSTYAEYRNPQSQVAGKLERSVIDPNQNNNSNSNPLMWSSSAPLQEMARQHPHIASAATSPTLASPSPSQGAGRDDRSNTMTMMMTRTMIEPPNNQILPNTSMAMTTSPAPMATGSDLFHYQRIAGDGGEQKEGPSHFGVGVVPHQTHRLIEPPPQQQKQPDHDNDADLDYFAAFKSTDSAAAALSTSNNNNEDSSPSSIETIAAYQQQQELREQMMIMMMFPTESHGTQQPSVVQDSTEQGRRETTTTTTTTTEDEEELFTDDVLESVLGAFPHYR